jgi:hypothetical protein
LIRSVVVSAQRRWNVCERGVLSSRMLATTSHSGETVSRVRARSSTVKVIVRISVALSI